MANKLYLILSYLILKESKLSMKQKNLNNENNGDTKTKSVIITFTFNKTEVFRQRLILNMIDD